MKAHCLVYGCCHGVDDDAVVLDEHLMGMFDVDRQRPVASYVDLVETRLFVRDR